ncbi:type I-E CRISPR-associated protein Cse1/CasA [Actinomyces radicidentis]|uniref:type I-E CRISPR-associated protein Cse1/CasA n=1 Tax=Actinomyces radicidentis TaxID=111015 RepID=UPI0028EBC643|nr:type I-E CRISPR-associated protein Cse1/CasA [Actinomyces radicidentis]
MMTFNLLDEPWIGVGLADGGHEEVSLLDAFRRAPQIAGIRGEIATQDMAVLRLLIAIAHRALEGPSDLDAWTDVWEEPELLADKVVPYLERFRDRFDLRDPEKPFFQVAGIHSATGKTSPLSSLIVDVPNGNPFFTTRRAGGVDRLTWAEAARWLVHVHAYDPSGIRSGAVGDPEVKGGKGYPIGPGWTGQIGAVAVEGDSLAETILLNTVVPSELNRLSEVDREPDLPPWEREADPVMGVPRRMSGPVTSCTWQTRRVLLHGDHDGATSVFLGNGDKATPQNRFGVEAMTAWRYSEPQSKKLGATVYMPKEHRTDRAFWRSLNSLVPGLGGTRQIGRKGHEQSVAASLPPGVLEFRSVLQVHRVLPRGGLVRLHAVGIEYGAQQAVVSELIDTHLDVPAALLDEKNVVLAQKVRDAMEESDAVVFVVKRLASNIVLAQGGGPDLRDAAANAASAALYQRLDGRFPAWLSSLAEHPDDASQRWHQVLADEARAAADALADAASATAITGRGTGKEHMDLGKALIIFLQALGKVLPNDSLSTDKEIS